MIKLMRIMNRDPDYSVPEFERRWEEELGAAVESSPAEGPVIRRYVQNRTINPDRVDLDSTLRRVAERWWDGVSEIWFDDVKSLRTWKNSSYYRETVQPRIEDLLDVENSPAFITQDVHMDAKPTHPEMVKSVGPLKPREDISPREFHRHWQYEHGPLVMSTDSWEPYVSHYVQTHVMEFAHEGEPRYLGFPFVWFEDLPTLSKWLQHEDIPNIITPDEENFLDRSELKMILMRERSVL